ncbi:MAG: endonuclease, partial [Cyclobacteriaceae bacterium]
MKKTVVLTFLQILFITLAFGQSAPPDDLSGNDLKTWLKDNWYTGKFQDQGYNAARTAMYSTIDKRQDGRVYGVYSGFSQESQSTTYLNPINAEHSIPQSFFSENAPMKSDIMHLFPTHQNVNSARGSNPFDDITDSQTDTWYGNDQSGLSSSSSIPQSNIDDYSERTSNAFEPREDHKGDLARVIFYFFTVYDLSSYGRDIEDLALGGDL